MTTPDEDFEPARWRVIENDIEIGWGRGLKMTHLERLKELAENAPPSSDVAYTKPARLGLRLLRFLADDASEEKMAEWLEDALPDLYRETLLAIADVIKDRLSQIAMEGEDG